jgi:hypothetical protein
MRARKPGFCAYPEINMTFKAGRRSRICLASSRPLFPGNMTSVRSKSTTLPWRRNKVVAISALCAFSTLCPAHSSTSPARSRRNRSSSTNITVPFRGVAYTQCSSEKTGLIGSGTHCAEFLECTPRAFRGAHQCPLQKRASARKQSVHSSGLTGDRRSDGSLVSEDCQSLLYGFGKAMERRWEFVPKRQDERTLNRDSAQLHS